MTTDQRKEYIKKWKQDHPEQVKEHNKTANQKRIVTKRCPECRKHRDFRKSLVSIRCKRCNQTLNVIKTLSVSVKNTHGIMLKVVA